MREMVSFSLASAWMPVLLEAAENVRSRTRKTMLNKPALGLVELKRLLDTEAQQAIHETLRQASRPIRVISEEGDYAIERGGPYLIVDRIREPGRGQGGSAPPNRGPYRMRWSPST
jgi:fructose-1,6-bisphosphatase/inositol monophosphatase family enzyme